MGVDGVLRTPDGGVSREREKHILHYSPFGICGFLGALYGAAQYFRDVGREIIIIEGHWRFVQERIVCACRS